MPIRWEYQRDVAADDFVGRVPNIFAAPEFQLRMLPSTVALIIASLVDSKIAGSNEVGTVLRPPELVSVSRMARPTNETNSVKSCLFSIQAKPPLLTRSST
jgi:hypothetical protein